MIKRPFLLGLIGFGIIFASSLLTTYYPEILWFDSFGLSDVWWLVFKSKLTVFGAAFLAAFVWLFVQLRLAWSNSQSVNESVPLEFNTPFDGLNRFLSQLRDQATVSQIMQLPGRLLSRLMFLWW